MLVGRIKLYSQTQLNLNSTNSEIYYLAFLRQNCQFDQMNRNIAIIVILAAVLALIPGLVLFVLNSSFLNSQKFEVSNMRITYAHGIGDYPQVIINFTVRNLYNSYISTVGVTIDGADYGSSTLQVNPGQAQEASIPLNNFTLSSSKTYGVKLTFAFADGQYQTYLGSYTTPQFKGEATVTSKSLIVYFTGYYNVGHFNLVIQNTGNLPITEAKCVFWVFDPILSNYYALPGEKLGFSGNFALSSYPAISAYPVTIQVTYSDGSTSTIDTSVTAQS